MTAAQLALLIAQLAIFAGVWKLTVRRKPPSITPPTDAERLAHYELRMGQHRARKRLQAAKVRELLDHRSARQVVAIVRSINREYSQ